MMWKKISILMWKTRKNHQKGKKMEKDAKKIEKKRLIKLSEKSKKMDIKSSWKA